MQDDLRQKLKLLITEKNSLQTQLLDLQMRIVQEGKVRPFHLPYILFLAPKRDNLDFVLYILLFKNVSVRNFVSPRTKPSDMNWNLIGVNERE